MSHMSFVTIMNLPLPSSPLTAASSHLGCFEFSTGTEIRICRVLTLRYNANHAGVRDEGEWPWYSFLGAKLLIRHAAEILAFSYAISHSIT